MSILKYFKPISKVSDTLFKELPEPNGALSETMLPSAITVPNNEVSKLKGKQDIVATHKPDQEDKMNT